MKIRIENGVTIISTGDATGGKKNKNGYTGVHYYAPSDCFRADINYKCKKYSLGFSKDIIELANLRKEAEQAIKDGTFEEWFETLKRSRTRKKWK